MIIVSGCPRSGTSLMMELMRQTFGEDRIIGTKFPQESKGYRKRPGEADDVVAYKQWEHERKNPNEDEKLKMSKDMNPNGFWECPFTVQGAWYRPRTAELLKKIEAETTPSICKIVSQGLRKTDPRYVTKIVYMLREPTAVAKSQERLKREVRFKTKDGKVKNLWDSMDKISPKMFIEVSLAAASWIRDYPDVPVHFVEYTKLMSNPKETLLAVQEFLGEGDFTTAISAIDPKLNRSSKVTITHPLLPEAEGVFEMLKAKNWDGLRAFSSNKRTKINRQTKQWVCVRSGSLAQDAICCGCVTDPAFRASLKGLAENNHIDWKVMPCSYECAYDVERDTYLSVEDSIKNNHWID